MSANSRPLIAVSQRVDAVSGRDETRDALDQNLAAWLFGAGYLAVPVPNALGAEEGAVGQWVDAIAPVLVLLSGGNSIGDAPCRDRTEAALLDWAGRRGRPVLGICRGMQMMGVAAGGVLVPVTGHVRTQHELDRPWPGTVNSYHDFGFTDVPPGYRVLSRAADGIIEAMQHETLPWEGWMWHPERGAPRIEDLSKLRAILNHDQRL